VIRKADESTLDKPSTWMLAEGGAQARRATLMPANSQRLLGAVLRQALC